jgi:peptide/nickel transport system ATP-binding protein
MTPPLLEVRDLRVRFHRPGARCVEAVKGVSLSLTKGETLGLVGESGCGKTSLSRAILGIIPCEGQLFLEGKVLDWRNEGPALRRRMQLIFQDPYASLNPRLTIGQALEEPLWVHLRLARAERLAKVGHMLERVGLPPDALGRYPHAFSGGQRQRVAIARALILEPAFVIADEPVSALDVSVQAQILNVLADMKAALGLTMLFISHDLAVIRHVADRVAVMKEGEIVETGPAAEVMQNPKHPYTQTLLAAAFHPLGHGYEIAN